MVKKTKVIKPKIGQDNKGKYIRIKKKKYYVEINDNNLSERELIKYIIKHLSIQKKKKQKSKLKQSEDKLDQIMNHKPSRFNPRISENIVRNVGDPSVNDSVKKLANAQAHSFEAQAKSLEEALQAEKKQRARADQEYSKQIEEQRKKFEEEKKKTEYEIFNNKQKIDNFENQIQIKEKQLQDYDLYMFQKQHEIINLEKSKDEGEISLKKYKKDIERKQNELDFYEKRKEELENTIDKIYGKISNVAVNIADKEARLEALHNFKFTDALNAYNEEYKEKLSSGKGTTKNDLLNKLLEKPVKGYEYLQNEYKDVKENIKKNLIKDIDDVLYETKRQKEWHEIQDYLLENEDRINEFMDHQNEEPINEVNQEGLGKTKINEGLSTNQINTIMKKHKNFIGTVPRDKVFKLKNYVKPGDSVGFVVNTDPASKPGKHWVGVYINPNSVNYFDSFGRPCPSDIRLQIKYIVDKMKPKTLLKFKENRIKLQNVSTNNCGYFVMKFLKDMFSGKPFVEATPFGKVSKTIQGEKQIKKFKETLKPFSWF